MYKYAGLVSQVNKYERSEIIPKMYHLAKVKENMKLKYWSLLRVLLHNYQYKSITISFIE